MELERRVAAEGRRASREPSRAARAATCERTAGTGRQRLEQRWVATTFGRVRIERYRVKGPQGSSHPTDLRGSLAGSEASPGLREAICELALMLRQAA